MGKGQGAKGARARAKGAPALVVGGWLCTWCTSQYEVVRWSLWTVLFGFIRGHFSFVICTRAAIGALLLCIMQEKFRAVCMNLVELGYSAHVVPGGVCISLQELDSTGEATLSKGPQGQSVDNPAGRFAGESSIVRRRCPADISNFWLRSDGMYTLGRSPLDVTRKTWYRLFVSEGPRLEIVSGDGICKWVRPSNTR